MGEVHESHQYYLNAVEASSCATTLPKIFDLMRDKTLFRLFTFTLVATIGLVSITGAVNMKTARVAMEITHLVTDEQRVTFSFTTYSTGTIPEYQYSKVNSLGRPMILHFTLLNATDTLSTYFQYLTVKCRVKSTTGSFNQQVSVTFDGTRITDATVTLTSTYSVYDLKVSGGYETKGVAATKNIALGVWATEA